MMVTISKSLNSQKLHQYHKSEYAQATQKNYYNEGAQPKGEWHGKLAQEMGLTGAVSSEEFARLSEGQDPFTSEQLVRHRIATDTSVAHRAAWDATFSASKSVSITALVGGDERISAAFQKAAHEGLDYMERSVHARIGGNTPAVHTGKWAVATFQHDTSRPVEGYSAPELHLHSVFFNLSKTADGQDHALQERYLFEAQKGGTAVAQARLTYELRQLGYEIEIGKNGAPEIKGYTAEYLQENSRRSQQIDKAAGELMTKYGLSEPEARQRAAHSTREKKSTKSAAEIRADQLTLARQHGNQHEAVLARAKSRHLAQEHLSPEDEHRAAMRRATKAVSYAAERQFEREAVVKEGDIVRDALRRGQGYITLEHVEHLVEHRRNAGKLLVRNDSPTQRTVTTPEMVTLEKENIQMMQACKNTARPLLNRNAISEEGFAKLNAGQKAAADQLLNSQDKVQALQGAAGTGKTTLLRPIVADLQRAGYTCKGFAPTSRAAKNLRDAGLTCSTLQKHLASKPAPSQDRTVYFLDETSLASTKEVHAFLSRLGNEDRVILIGDVRQHESVEAGRVFAQLQEHGISTARLDEIVRQSQADEGLKAAVKHIATGQVREGLRLLTEQNRVIEIKDEQARYTRIAQEYIKAPQKTLVVSADNRSRTGINAVIHDKLKELGHIETQDHRFTVLVENQDVTGADRKWASAYEVGNVLRYNTGEKKKNGALGIKAGDYATVTSIDADQNRLTVATKDGRSVSYDPERFHGVSIFHEQERGFAVGERIQFTAPTPDNKAVRRDLGEIESINKKLVGIKLDSGDELTVDTNSFRHLDHGYTTTSYSSQSLTFPNVIWNVETERTNPNLLNLRHSLVAATREQTQLLLLTDNAAAAPTALSRDVSKSSAIAPLPPQQQSHAQQERPGQHTQSNTPASTDKPITVLPQGQRVPSQQPAITNHTPQGQRLLTPDQALQQISPKALGPQQQGGPTQAAALPNGPAPAAKAPGPLSGLTDTFIPGDVQQQLPGDPHQPAADPLRLVKQTTPQQAIVPGETKKKSKEEDLSQDQGFGFGF